MPGTRELRAYLSGLPRVKFDLFLAYREDPGTHDPEWPGEYHRYVHDWRRYVSPGLRLSWDAIGEDLRAEIRMWAEDRASNEEWD